MQSEGWYLDPWDTRQQRWWSGCMWTTHTRPISKSRLHPSLSWPILAGAPLALLNALAAVLYAPTIVLLVAISGGAVLAAFLWLDRVEPEPIAAKLHAILWGGTTAVSIALVGNETVGALYGEIAGAVIAAPVFEEVAKGLGIWWMVRKGRVRTGFDGVVYAGLVAGGFAAVENFIYFGIAAMDGSLLWSFFTRGVMTPFAHPLFTLLTGFGIAVAAQQGRNVRIFDFWGLPLAIALHAGWNGSLAAIEAHHQETGSAPAWWPLVVLGYATAFILAAATLFLVRKKATRLYPRWIGTLAFTYNLTPIECATFDTWDRVKARRKALSRRDRAAFDVWHSAIVRLMEHHAGGRRGGDVGLVRALHEARRIAPVS